MQHTVREYEAELDRLRQRILFMGAEVERNFELAIASLRLMDAAVAQGVIEADNEIDELQLELDEWCLRLLARWQPLASDLRFITSTFRLVTDLERTADLAVNVSERVKELCALNETVPTSRNLVHMAELALGQLHDALDAFVSGNVRQAELVTQRDATVDSLYAQLFPELIAQMVGSPERADAAMRQQSIGKSVERIADHATNIAETVIFMVQGKDIRHQHTEAKRGPLPGSRT
jgi:phosphate transport system protein